MKDKSKMSSNLQTAAEATISAVGTKATYAGSVTTLGGWLLSSEVIAVCGLALAVLGFVVNLVFKIREDRRQSEAHELSKKRAAESDPHVKKLLDEIPRIMMSNRMRGPNDFPAGHGNPEETSEEGKK
jgi:hypothetical protein